MSREPLREALEWIANRPTNWQNEEYIAPLRDRARAALREESARDAAKDCEKVRT